MPELVVFGPYPPPYGGVSIFVYQLTEHLKRLGIPFTLRKFQGLTNTPPDAVLPQASSILRHFGSLKAGAVFVDNGSIFLEYPATETSRRLRWGLQWGWLALKTLKRFRWLKVIHDGTLIERYNQFSPLQKRVFHQYAAYVDEFITVSPQLAEWLRQEIGVKQPIHVIRSLLPLVPYGDTSLSAEAEKALAKHDYVVCSVGAFTNAYGFAQIANAVEQARAESGKNIGLILLDAGFTGVAAYREEVLKGREWITAISRSPHPQVLAILKRCQVFVRGVEAESYGLSKVEAIWCGLRVVATRVGETRGMLLYDYGDEAMLTQQLLIALFEPENRELQGWSETYLAEAEANLQLLLRVIETK